MTGLVQRRGPDDEGHFSSEEALYKLAITTQPGFVRPASNRFLLPRLSLGGSLPKVKQQLKELG